MEDSAPSAPASPTEPRPTAKGAAELQGDEHGHATWHGQGLRLLLAEDNPVSREIVLALLKDLGLAIDVAEDGQDAVERVRRQPYDLVLMDLQMPRLDGIAATRQIRALPHGRQLPILAVTANVFEDDQRSCQAVGMNGFLSKPVDPQALRQQLRHWLPPGRRVGTGVGGGPATPARHDAGSAAVTAPSATSTTTTTSTVTAIATTIAPAIRPADEAALQHLAALVGSGDILALDEAERLATTLAERLGEPAATALLRQIRRFEFDLAAAALAPWQPGEAHASIELSPEHGD
jgi:CheY-like chemotaxis protein